MKEREICFLFSDVAGFSPLIERFGDRRACRIMARHHRIVRRACAKQHGRELELRGDGFLLAFDESDQAIACAVAVQRDLERDRAKHPDEGVEVRMGIHRGTALRTGDQFFGRSLVVASRLADHARPSEILISSSVEDSLASPLSRWEARFGLTRRTRLRGLRGVARYRSVLWRPRVLPLELDNLNPIALAESIACRFEDAFVTPLTSLGRARG